MSHPKTFDYKPPPNRPVTPKFCAHCGMPVIRPQLLVVGGEEKAFCCGGCRTAYEIVRASEAEERARMGARD